MYVKDYWDGRKVIEDDLLNENVLSLIERLHGKIERIDKHYKVDGMEVDAIILCKRVKERLIGIELKEYDFFKVIQQAVQRRRYFNYFYVVTRGGNIIGQTMRCLYRMGLLSELFEHGIGWIVVNQEGQAWYLFASTYLKCGLI